MTDPAERDDLAAIQEALDLMPATCRYHGANLERCGPLGRPCCDTGKPSLARRRAEEALRRLSRAPGTDEHLEEARRQMEVAIKMAPILDERMKEARKLGRQQALAEVTQRLAEAGARGRFALQIVQHLDEYAARDTGKGDSV